MARRKKTTGTYKGRKYNGGTELAAMKMMDRLSKPKRRRRKKGCYVATAAYGTYAEIMAFIKGTLEEE